MALPEGRRPSFFGYALGYAFLVYMVAVVLWADTRNGEDMLASVQAGAFIGAPVGLLVCWVRSRKEKERYAREHANQVAMVATREANEILETCSRKLANLATWVRQANSFVNDAQTEYSERAFTPFWEAIEQAAVRLAFCADSARRLKLETERYASILSAKRHNFPSCPLHGPAPDPPAATLTAFSSILRQGQTDYQFANIWGKMKTEEAVETLSKVRYVADAFADLHATVSAQR